MAMGPCLAEIKQIKYLILKNQAQGCNENLPKSNQVIDMSGPLILPKMKKIWKKFFRSYHVNKSLWHAVAAAVV